MLDLNGVEEKYNVFKQLKDLLIHAPNLSLPNFQNCFEIECDVSNTSINLMLLQEEHPIACIRLKLKKIPYDKECIRLKLKKIPYDKEAYSPVKKLKTWQYYVLTKEFMIGMAMRASLPRIGISRRIYKLILLTRPI